jgi:MFS transporter, ACS family, D-galactonate transporter
MIAESGDPVAVRKWFTIAGFAIACTELIGAQTSSVAPGANVCRRFAFGSGAATANYWALTQTLVPAAAIGRVSGIQNCTASVSGIVAPILTGWLKQQTGRYRAPMQVIWFVLVAGILSYLVFIPQKYASEMHAEQSIAIRRFC